MDDSTVFRESENLRYEPSLMCSRFLCRISHPASVSSSRSAPSAVTASSSRSLIPYGLEKSTLLPLRNRNLLHTSPASLPAASLPEPSSASSSAPYRRCSILAFASFGMRRS